MATRPLRFVHTSDLHLEQPPFGLGEIPEHLRELFIECAYWSAERVFAVVLAEEADWLVLSGDVLQAQQTGPRGPLFLAEQFGRLAERGIQVFWAGGEVDPPEGWPASVRLPENVHIFPAHRIGRFTYERDGIPLADVIGVSRRPEEPVHPDEFPAAPEGLVTVAAMYGEVEADALRSRSVDYWALGGRHDRATLFGEPHAAHYPGTPQGREPGQVGPHGCTLVQIDTERRVRTTLVPADVMRWHNERIAIDPGTTRKDLESRLYGRIEALKQANPGADLFVSWTVVGEGPLLVELRRGALGSGLLETMRSEHGFGSPAVWSVALGAEPLAGVPTPWYEQETILGDFLRELRQQQVDPEMPVSLEGYLAEADRAGPLAELASVAPGPDRERVLREAALLGCDLLSGEDPVS